MSEFWSDFLHLIQNQLDAIYTNYKVDFEMFNYTMDKYIPIVKP